MKMLGNAGRERCESYLQNHRFRHFEREATRIDEKGRFERLFHTTVSIALPSGTIRIRRPMWRSIIVAGDWVRCRITRRARIQRDKQVSETRHTSFDTMRQTFYKSESH